MPTSGAPALDRASVASFRDPGGIVIRTRDGIFRWVSNDYAGTLTEFLRTQPALDALASEELAGTRLLPSSEYDRVPDSASLAQDGIFLEHDRIPFASYPYEWAPAMLHAAGMLTLRLAESALNAGFGLKDATPYNVLFRGPKPVFVDVLSFERRDPRDPIWLPYAQFQRMFVFPLLLARYSGGTLSETLLARADGIEPEDVYKRTGLFRRLTPSYLGNVSIPVWLSGSKGGGSGSAPATRTQQMDAEKAQYVLQVRLRSARKLLDREKPVDAASSNWSSYMRTLSYSDQDFQTKSDTVGRWLAGVNPKAVLDVGCNTGHFSALAAKAGARVVAIDADQDVVSTVWQRAIAEKLDILPLVVNLARPTPACGWRNQEYSSFLDRAAQAFDVVMMLAVIHHLLVTERIPLPEIIAQVAAMTTGYAILEYVSKEDEMFRTLTRGRDALHAGFTQEAFEQACQSHFTILEKQPSKGNLRCLYLLRRA